MATSQGLWFTEMLSEHLGVSTAVETVFHKGKSEFQDVEVLGTAEFGRCLVLDHKMQSAELDEFVYHESLVHAAMLAHPSPKKVFICGGGEGATLREVLRHKSVERCIMVDIDAIAVQTSKDFLLRHHAGAFDDPRTELIIDDAKKQLLAQADDSLDVIVMDLADPLPGGPCYLLYTKAFFEIVKSKLAPNGVVVTQSGPAGLNTHSEVFVGINKTMSQVFPHVHSATFHVPSFSDMYSVCVGVQHKEQAPPAAAPDAVDAAIADRITGGADALQYYDGATHINLFGLNKYLRKAIATAGDDLIITEDHPRFIF